MSEQIKYEAVFGDQSLFEGFDNETIAVCYNSSLGVYSKLLQVAVDARGSTELRANPIVAMRRIIRTPTWTKEDQKAGRLPVSGCKAEYIPGAMVVRKCHVICVNENKAWIELDDKSWSGFVDVKKLIAIESPEEKANRLEDEWVALAKHLTLREIYKAQIAGELPVPVKGE